MRRSLILLALAVSTSSLQVLIATTAASDPVITAAGDIASEGEPSTAQGETARLVPSIDPRAALTLGDNQYQDGELADFEGKRVGVWDFGNEFEVTAAASEVGLEEGEDYEKVIQPFDMSLLLNREVDIAEAMIYNEYAQVLESVNPETGELFQPEDLVVIDYNDVGTAMLQDAIHARAAWLAEEGNEDIAIRFLAGAFKGWAYCRDNPDDCVQFTVDAGSTLGLGHQNWMMNEINALIWPSPDGIGDLPEDTWQKTIDISVDAEIIDNPPAEGAYRTDLAEAARALVGDVDLTGADFTKGEVEVTPGGE